MPAGTERISAYVPCYNNKQTVRRAVESLLAQTAKPLEVLVVDDGSVDGSINELRGLDVRIVHHDRNQGRGAARARAMAEAKHGIVLCCDATNVLDPKFAEMALIWLAEAGVAAVFGRIAQPEPRGLAERWRGRHLFKVDAGCPARRHAMLATWGAMVRSAPVREVGGYDRNLRHSEDGDLGRRLSARGWDVVYDPAIEVRCVARNTCLQVLERYWRWYAGADEAVTWRGYWKNAGFAVKAMAAADLRAGDPASAFLSLIAPHYQFWRSRLRRQWGHSEAAAKLR